MNISVDIEFENLYQKSIYQGQSVVAVARVATEPVGGPRKFLSDEEQAENFAFDWLASFSHYTAPVVRHEGKPWKATLLTDGIPPNTYHLRVLVKDKHNGQVLTENGVHLEVKPAPATAAATSGPRTVALARSSTAETRDVALWQAIRQSSAALSFDRYERFINKVMHNRLGDEERAALNRAKAGRGTPFAGIGKYQLLKTATEVFVMMSCRVLGGAGFFGGDAEAVVDEYNVRNDRHERPSDLRETWRKYLVDVSDDESGVLTLPYLALISRRLGDQVISMESPEERQAADVLDEVLQDKLTQPCFFELIWSYWLEEGMLVQTLNAIAVRFQNQRTSARDPLSNLTLAPLHAISPILFGYIQDEQHRLSVARRAYEYDHEYGFTLHGKAVPPVRGADSRSKFLEAFHNLLNVCVAFYRQDDNTTIIADGFPVLNALKEVHLLLAEGADNQFGNLTTAARVEMLMQQWILARPEIREFMGGRPSVPYAEPWMDRVDSMKKLMNWSDVSITYFHDLARFGEQILLSIRYGSWSEIFDPHNAVNWARDFRPPIQQYNHAYRAVTGVDLGVKVTDPRSGDRLLPPSVHLRRRLEVQQAQGAGKGRLEGGRALPRLTNGGNGRALAGGRPAVARPQLEYSEES